jgi:hypothetical protein
MSEKRFKLVRSTSKPGEEHGEWEVAKDDNGELVTLSEVELHQVVGTVMQRAIIVNESYNGNPVYMLGMFTEDHVHDHNFFMSFEQI